MTLWQIIGSQFIGAKLARLIVLALSLALLAGQLGFLHQGFDAVAVFRLHLLPVLAVLLMATFRLKMPLVRIFAGFVAMLSVVTIAPFAREMGAGPLAVDWRLFQQNMMIDNPRPADVAQYILDNKPEFVTLQEVSHRNAQVLDPLASTYPTQVRCPQSYGFGVVILTRFPVVAGAKAGCDDIEKIAWARVQSKNGPLTIVAVHLNWPWPWNYAGRQRRIQRILSELPQPMVIAGDFNMVPWAVALQRLQGRTGTGWVGPMRFSFRPNGLQVLLPIDQVLVPKGFEGRTKLVPGLGSDHYGLWVRVGRRTPPP